MPSTKDPESHTRFFRPGTPARYLAKWAKASTVTSMRWSALTSRNSDSCNAYAEAKESKVGWNRVDTLLPSKGVCSAAADLHIGRLRCDAFFSVAAASSVAWSPVKP